MFYHAPFFLGDFTTGGILVIILPCLLDASYNRDYSSLDKREAKTLVEGHNDRVS